MTVDVLLERTGASLKRHKSGCLTAETAISDSRVVLARSLTFMNETGRAVRALLSWYKVPPERLIVVHDELDIPFGEVRVKVDGGTAGHNGLSSVSAHLGTKKFVRVRIGVSRPGRMDAADYVLKEFSASDRKELPQIIESAADAVERIVEVGSDRAMNEFNTRK
jgi:peptidyl-tRNA hydrolase, PTH1 family